VAKTLIDDSRAEAEYFKANGWPTNIDGSLRTIHTLDKGELLAIATLYAKMLQGEFASITVPEKRART
jgi:hypothetical protein